VQYNNENDEKVLSVGKKTFSHLKHQDIFCEQDALWVSTITQVQERLMFTPCALSGLLHVIIMLFLKHQENHIAGTVYDIILCHETSAMDCY